MLENGAMFSQEKIQTNVPGFLWKTCGAEGV